MAKTFIQCYDFPQQPTNFPVGLVSYMLLERAVNIFRTYTYTYIGLYMCIQVYTRTLKQSLLVQQQLLVFWRGYIFFAVSVVQTLATQNKFLASFESKFWTLGHPAATCLEFSDVYHTSWIQTCVWFCSRHGTAAFFPARHENRNQPSVR